VSTRGPLLLTWGNAVDDCGLKKSWLITARYAEGLIPNLLPPREGQWYGNPREAATYIRAIEQRQCENAAHESQVPSRAHLNSRLPIAHRRTRTTRRRSDRPLSTEWRTTAPSRTSRQTK
jgi:hypothetical protein